MVSIVTVIALSAITASGNPEYVAMTPEIIDGLQMNNPQGLAVNPVNEEFLVTDALNNRVLIFDSSATLVFSFPLGEDRRNPLGIAVNSFGEIIVGAMDLPELWVYNYAGDYINTIELPAGALPGRLLADSTGVLVIDRNRCEILRLDREGNLIAKYEFPQEGCKPTGLCLDKSGTLYLVSTAGAALTTFGSNGKSSNALGIHGNRPEDFSHPTSAASDARGDIWVVDSFRHEIKHFGSNHQFLGTFGSRGTDSGEFFFPIDIKITARGKMGILEKGTGRLQIFNVSYGN